jgi:hypothetical protein
MVTLPSSLETIGPQCFWKCGALEEVHFPEDSKLLRIAHEGFGGCRALRAFVIPRSVVSVGSGCFHECSSLSGLAFARPSQLRELLSIPLVWDDPIEIPDSVERLVFVQERKRPRSRTFAFGPDSQLSEFTRDTQLGWYGRRSFLRFSSGTLKRFRSTLEFDDGMIREWKRER